MNPILKSYLESKGVSKDLNEKSNIKILSFIKKVIPVLSSTTILSGFYVNN